jgi:hypothetical protein
MATTFAASFGRALRTESAWTREVRAVLHLAEERGLCLDEDRLLLSDVRDLQALGGELRALPSPRAHVHRAAQPRLRRYLAGCGPAFS